MLLTPESLDVDELADELGVVVVGVVVVGVVVVGVVVDADVLDPVLGVVAVSPEASAVLATPDTRPSVIAVADRAAAPAAIRPRMRRRFGESIGFIPATMLSGGSGPRHHNVKCLLSLAETG